MAYTNIDDPSAYFQTLLDGLEMVQYKDFTFDGNS